MLRTHSVRTRAGHQRRRPAGAAALASGKWATTAPPAPDMPLPPQTASELARIRAQVVAGRLEWQDSTEPAAHIPVESYTRESIRDAEIARLFRPLPLIVGHGS